jgi:hypothetical protein
LISHEDKRDQCKSPFWVLEDLNCPGFSWKKAPASNVFYPKTNLAVSSIECCQSTYSEREIGVCDGGCCGHGVVIPPSNALLTASSEFRFAPRLPRGLEYGLAQLLTDCREGLHKEMKKIRLYCDIQWSQYASTDPNSLAAFQGLSVQIA